MRRFTIYSIGTALLALCPAVHATTFTFNTDPFAGTNVLTTPGRQVVGNEQFVNFSITNDTYSLDAAALGLGNSVHFANGLVDTLPTSGANVIVLENFDNDNNPATPFGAPNAADLIASRVTTPGPGVFIYFNQALNLPRLVYSTDLSSSNAALKILARMINLTGATGQNAMPTFTAANFTITSDASPAPEPSSLLLTTSVGLFGLCNILRRMRSDA
jgi:hypothetical protein